MRGTRIGQCVWPAVAACLLATGCVTTDKHSSNYVPLPPPGSVPTELGKVTLPPYVIEPPDVLLIEARTINDKNETFDLPIQPVGQQFLVRPDGTVSLGYYGSVPVAGLTLEQAAEAVRAVLIARALPGTNIKEDKLFVVLDVLAYNSKWYYVLTDGGGAGEQSFKFPIQGYETVLDALSQPPVNGLSPVSSKRHIWVARRSPHGGPDQVLPVDWVGMTQHGITQTNYQLMPGDRIYVKAQKLVTIDTALARFLSPIERVLGTTLLGASTVNQINGRFPGQGGGF
jgi:polysaccharide export outer membrane protein